MNFWKVESLYQQIRSIFGLGPVEGRSFAVLDVDTLASIQVAHNVIEHSAVGAVLLTNVEVGGGLLGEQGAVANRGDRIQEVAVEVLFADSVVADVGVDDVIEDLVDRDVGSVSGPAIGSEGARVLVELAGEAILPELLGLLDGHLGDAHADSGAQALAL